MDAKVIEALKVIKELCKSKIDCSDCELSCLTHDADYRCILGHMPMDWDLSELEKDGEKVD